ncbi:hypothetical protein WJX74_000170 [Apatococcus lobatus]|uniref:EF-hand domain-containing protein n=2 Tax=Apatococcus TaxID=904362 RepID=A0AAW1S984_9CHLO
MFEQRAVYPCRHSRPWLWCPTRSHSVQKRRRTGPISQAEPAHAQPSGTSLPEDDDENIIRDAFMKSYQEAQPCQVRIPGMQDFAAAVWNRYRSIPSSRRTGGSSLDTLFDEFDKDGDGHLTAAEIASALNSRGVLITEQEAAMFIKACDINSNETVERYEWPDFVWSMAAADLSPDNLDMNLPRCVTEPQIELEIEPSARSPFLEDSSTPHSLRSWFQLRTQPPGRAPPGPS